ncbi:hypothetical protein M8C21_000953 [Ambrosia artemisiifolia]|uniref:Uncharacterized protein n=1 Tax=Ambrosia artemisiifolia TaxID=4212 RepID=A0AAD5BST1_AMBAR|nr:hypothetical protein M8C21_000953 [Ambrosia artemisiifolia]
MLLGVDDDTNCRISINGCWENDRNLTIRLLDSHRLGFGFELGDDESV